MIRDCSTEEVSQVLDQATVRRVLDALRDELRRVLLTPEEAALALKISERKLWDLTATGDIPCLRIGRLVRYRRETLERWAERNERKGLTG